MLTVGSAGFCSPGTVQSGGILRGVWEMEWSGQGAGLERQKKRLRGTWRKQRLREEPGESRDASGDGMWLPVVRLPPFVSL